MTRLGIGLTALLGIAWLTAGCRGACCPDQSKPSTVAASRVAEPSTIAPAEHEPARPWLKKKVKNVQFEDASLDHVTTYLQTITGKTFHLSQKVRDEKLDKVAVNLTADEVEVHILLAQVFYPNDLRWQETDGVVNILTASEFHAGLRLRYYDVKDLVAMKAAPARPPGAPQPPPVADPELEKRLVVELKRALPPGSWEEKRMALETRHGILVARATKPVLEAIEEFLGTRRAGGAGGDPNAGWRPVELRSRSKD